jgi:parvulin-like peptidyl-prolyl isomerase
MAINPELAKWLSEKVYGQVTPEERTALENAFGKDAVAEQLNRAWMAPPDYNRKMDELKVERQRLEQETQQYAATLNQWRDGEQARVNREVEAIRAQHERDVAALRAQVEAEGLTPSVAQPVKPNGSATPNGNGQPKYLTKADLDSELARAAMYPALITQVVERHRKLFNDVPDMEKVTDTALRTGRTIIDTWRDTYKVADREAELHNAEIQKKIEDGVSERLAKLQADGAMNAQNFTGRQSDPSPIRQMIALQRQADANSPLAIPQPVQQGSEGVRQAVELLNSGRFEVKRPGQ